MSPTPESTWSFDLGTGSLGEAIVKGNKVEHLVPWMTEPTLASTKDSRVRRRAWRTRKAHSAREAWLDELWDKAGLERPKPRQVGKLDEDGNPIVGEDARRAKGPWQQVQDPDYRIEREFAPSGKRPQKDDAPAESIFYTSCILRIKLLQGGDDMEDWQIYKALRAALQSRGQQRVPWAKKEAAREGISVEEIEQREKQELANKDPVYRQAMTAWETFSNADADHWTSLPEGKRREDYLYPCYYDAWRMGLWSPEKPDELKPRHTYEAQSTRQIVFPGERVEAELFKLAENAAVKIPALRAAAQAIIHSFVTERVEKLNERRAKKNEDPLNENEIVVVPRASNFPELLVYGPAGKPSQADSNKPVRALALSDPTKCKALALRPGTDFDWKSAVGQKIPRFENRIISRCALFPRLNACKVVPRIDKDGKVRPESLLAAQVIFLLQAKNLEVIENGKRRYLRKEEIAALLQEAENGANSSQGKKKEEKSQPPAPALILERYKLTKTNWKSWCNEKKLDGTPSIPVKQSKGLANDGTDTSGSSGKSKDVIKAPALDGRCRFSRPALALLKDLLLNAEDGDQTNPKALLENLANGVRELTRAKPPCRHDGSGDHPVEEPIPCFVVVEKSSKTKKSPQDSAQEASSGGGGFSRPLPRPTEILKSEIENLIGRVWKKQNNDAGEPILYAPHQLTIPDLTLDDVEPSSHAKPPSRQEGNGDEQAPQQGEKSGDRYKELVDALVCAIRKWNGNSSDFAEIDKAAEDYWKHRKRITDLIGEQNNPIVRDRLTRFWGRLCRMQHPVEDPKLAEKLIALRQQTTADLLEEKKKTEVDKERLGTLQRRLAALQDLRPGMGKSAPSFVTLEFAREDNNSLYGAKRKAKIKASQDAQEEKRENAKKALEEAKKEVTETNITKRLLWEEQGKQDLYSGKGLGCTNYLDCEICEIDHIVPRSIGGPDAFYNLILTSKESNGDKFNRTPWRWFKECKSDDEWKAYCSRVEACTELSKLKKKLLLSEQAEQLVKQTRDLNDTAWIARIAQKVVRLHFGWPHESTAGAIQRIHTVNGGLTARIRRRYALDALLDAGKRAKVWNVIKELRIIDKEPDAARSKPEPDEQNVEQLKQNRQAKRQELRQLAVECEKNRADPRHHALDALVLSFIPFWTKDDAKEDLFRFPKAIGDRRAIVESNKEAVKELNDKIEEAREKLNELRKEPLTDDVKSRINDLERDWFDAEEKRSKLLLPPNIPAVWTWFAQQILESHETDALEGFPPSEEHA